MKGIWFSPYPELNTVYKTSYPTNWHERVRMLLSRFFIRIGLKLTLKNGEVWVTTSSSNRNT